MKTKLLFSTLIVSALLFFTGCVTAPDGTKQVDYNRVANIAGVAADIGTRAVLAKNPEHRADFAAVEQALNALIDAKNYDPAAFSAALSSLRVRELKGPNGQIIISAAVIIWDEAAQFATGLDQRTLVALTLTRVRDGIHRALASTAN